jgi:hypothetical protein
LEFAAIAARRKNEELAARPPAFLKLWQEIQLPTAIFWPFITSGSLSPFFGVKSPSDWVKLLSSSEATAGALLGSSM